MVDVQDLIETARRLGRALGHLRGKPFALDPKVTFRQTHPNWWFVEFRWDGETSQGRGAETMAGAAAKLKREATLSALHSLRQDVAHGSPEERARAEEAMRIVEGVGP